VLKIILKAPADYAYAVDKLVASLSLHDSRDSTKYSLQYINDVVPLVVRAVNTIQSMDDVFWGCLGYGPRFLRDKSQGKRQIEVARGIVSQLNPVCFANSMLTLVSRDMEILARSLSVIHEVDAEFIPKIASLISHEDFLCANMSDWQTQSDELTHLLRFVCIGADRQPARNWVVRNETVIKGTLQPTFAAIAPQVAVRFHDAGKQVSLSGHSQHRWNETVWAISEIASVDKNACIEIVTRQLPDLETKLYDLTLDSPRYIILFFRLIHELSSELFINIVSRLDMDDSRAKKTICQLVSTQPNELANYRRLGRLTCRVGGKIGAIGKSLLVRLDQEIARSN
jgi:hypothetical protein